MRLTALHSFTLSTFLGLTLLGSHAYAKEPEEPKPASKTLPKTKLTLTKSCTDFKDHMTNVLTDQMVSSYYWEYYYNYYYDNYRYKTMPTSDGGIDMSPSVATKTTDSPKAAAPAALGTGAGKGASANAPSEAPSRYSKTNTQEKNVDELDFVKTDGKYIYVLQNNALTIFQSWPVQSTKQVSSFQVSGNPESFFLYGDRVAIVSSNYGNITDFAKGFDRYYDGSRVTIVDVSDRANPKELRHFDVEGYIYNGRMIGDEIYLIVESYMSVPYEIQDAIWSELPSQTSSAIEEIYKSKKNVKNELRKLFKPYLQKKMESADAQSWLPRMQETNGAVSKSVEPLFDCERVYRPNQSSTEASIMGVMHLDLGQDTSTADATGILGYGWIAYASTESLYLATDEYWWDYFVDDPYYYKASTDIHKFSLTKEGAKYVASGRVPGYLKDQFSMSEHRGYIRVASTDWDHPTGTKNYLTILAPNGNQLAKAGGIDNIAPGEEIYGVRMMGDKGYLVTFRQIDPLFTIDLKDPTNPKIVGELKIPGYSSYLHPIDKNHILAVGMDGTESGQITGAKVSLFDVSDFAKPKEKFSYKLTDVYGDSEAAWDHHAFTYLGGYLALPVTSYQKNYQYKQELVVMKVNTKEGFSELGRVNHDDLGSYASLRRSIIIESALFTLSNFGLKVSDLNVPAETYASLPFSTKK